MSWRIGSGPGTLARLTLAVLLASACGPAAAPTPAQHARPVTEPGIPPEWAFPAAATAADTAAVGMVATTDPLASGVGADVLRRGGNAVDAAVAVHFALAVVNPEAGNIGGGGYLVTRDAAGSAATLDFREMAPAGATPEAFLENGRLGDRSRIGHLAAGVPGSVAGMWEAHSRFGSLPWAALLQPAIRLAEGFPLHARLAESLANHADRLDDFEATRAAFLPSGRAPRPGEVFAQPDLAATLRRIAVDGPAGFYAGETARLIVQEMRRGGGLITRRDLAAYRAVWREPLSIGYRGYTVVAMPPSSSGGLTLAEMLNILEGYDLRSLGYHSAEHVHLFAEAAKLAYADRNTYLGDPDFVEVPTRRMASDEYAASRRAGIGSSAAPAARVGPGLGPAPAERSRRPEPRHTTHYSIVDPDGRAVSVTTTINSAYGSRVTVQGAGFLLNNEMDDFAIALGEPNQFGLVEGRANLVAPGKRMLSSMTPVIVSDPAGQLHLVTGSPGGSTIITTVAQIVSNVIDWGMDPAAATAAPRIHHQHLPDVLFYERNGLTPTVVRELTARGHRMQERSGYSGDTQTVLRLPDGRLVGASDPRQGGAPEGVQP